MKITVPKALSLMALLWLVPPAQAEPSTWQMRLTHHEFEDWAFSPKPGDTISILNQSDIAHAIYVTYPDGTVMTLTEHVQLPGTTVEWVVPQTPGDYLLKCWIHPVIQATLSVRTASPSTGVSHASEGPRPD